MVTDAQPRQEAPPPARRPRRVRPLWWAELLTIVAFYEVYSFARNAQGSASTSATHAFRNARTLVDIEKAMGLFFEERMQRAFVEIEPVMVFFNVYYGSAHFIVTAGALLWIYLSRPGWYRQARWTLAATTGLALVGFIAYPVMPPRLVTSQFGVYGFEDTLKTIGGLWSFDSGPIAKLSNQYAAMPSLHFAWSAWCGLVLWPHARAWWTRTLVVAHPVVTTVGIIITANHWWIDAAGGALTLGVGWAAGSWVATRLSGPPGGQDGGDRDPAGPAGGLPGAGAHAGRLDR